MAFAPYHNGEIAHRADLGAILGYFVERDHGHGFEFAARVDGSNFAADFPHQIFVGMGDESRFARVLKSVAYIVVDEAADGSPVVEKWSIKGHRIY